MNTVETWRRLRTGGSQTVRVEHVYVNEGGPAIIGNVRSGPAGEGHQLTLESILEFMDRERMQ